MKLYEINNEIMDLLASGVIDEETGEIINEDAFVKLEMLKGNYRDKVESVGLYIKNIESSADGIKKEIKVLSDRKAKLDREAKSLRGYLQYYMDQFDLKELSTSKIDLRFRRSTTIEVEDMSKVNKDYIKEKIELTVDKMKVKRDLKNGASISGVKEVVHNRLQLK